MLLAVVANIWQAGLAFDVAFFGSFFACWLSRPKRLAMVAASSSSVCGLPMLFELFIPIWNQVGSSGIDSSTWLEMATYSQPFWMHCQLASVLATSAWWPSGPASPASMALRNATVWLLDRERKQLAHLWAIFCQFHDGLSFYQFQGIWNDWLVLHPQLVAHLLVILLTLDLQTQMAWGSVWLDPNNTPKTTYRRANRFANIHQCKFFHNCCRK